MQCDAVPDHERPGHERRDSVRPRVLHVGKYHLPRVGGIETYLRTLCLGLAKRTDVRVLVAADGNTTVHESADDYAITRLGRLAEIASTPLCPGMTGALRQDQSDLVHLHLPNPQALWSYLASGHRGRLIVTYHSDVVRQRIVGRMLEPLLHRVLSRADAILVTSPAYANTSRILRRYDCDVVPFGIDTERFEIVDEQAVAAIREHYGPRIVLSAGRLVYYKGHEYLLRAMREIDGTLLVLGSGTLQGELQARARQLGIGGRVVFLGEVPDVVPYMHAADVFAFPSIARSEAFGIVQVEAMACGLPVVNTNLPTGVPFVSPDGLTGFTVPPCDAGALATAINRLLADPCLRTRMGAQGRSRVRQEFTAPLMTERIVSIYERVLQRRIGSIGDEVLTV